MKEKFDDISVRFLEALKENEITGYKLMKDGVIKSQASLTKIKSGKLKASMRLIDRCCKQYGLDKAWVLLGNDFGNISNRDGDQTIVSASSNSSIINSVNKGTERNTRSPAKPLKLYLRENLTNVPFVQQDAAASFIDNLGDMQNASVDTYGVMQENAEDLSNGKYVVFQVNGDSMTPNIPDDTKVLAQKIDERKWEEVSGVVFVAYGKTLTIKRVLKNNLYMDNALTLKADNPVYGQIDVSRNEIRGIWKAERIISQKIK